MIYFICKLNMFFNHLVQRSQKQSDAEENYGYLLQSGLQLTTHKIVGVTMKC